MDITGETNYQDKLNGHANQGANDPYNNEKNVEMIKQHLTINRNINFNEMVVDLFGNYVIQSIIQLPNLKKDFLEIIFERIKGNFYEFSIDIHGCRVM